MAKQTKTKRECQRAEVDRRSERAGYEVKDHGHRFFIRDLRVDSETGEVYLPDGYKMVELWGYSEDLPGHATCFIKDEHLG